MRLFLATAIAIAVSIGIVPPGLAGETVIRMKSDLKLGVDNISVDGVTVGRIRHGRETRLLEAGAMQVRLERTRRPIVADKPYPLRVVLTGQIGNSGPRVRQQYDLLAPLSPIEIEGLGVPFSGDDEGINAEEHALLQRWLESNGLEPDTRLFEEIHRAETGRDLRVWYEIAGRRVDGSVTIGDAENPAANFSSAFHVTSNGWKIHHARALLYHRKSLELVDTVSDERRGAPTEMRSYQCGCYEWAIGADWVTIGDRYLYHAVVEWQHHRVGAGFFVGLEGRGTFPWIGVGDRKKVARLARRVAAYRMTDARENLFAEIDVALDLDPPRVGLGPQSYVVRVTEADGSLGVLAEIAFRSNEIEIQLLSGQEDWRVALNRLDVLLAAMPTQVLRGDGIRDSYLGEVETLVDWIRLIEEPNEETLADVVSEIDAVTAVAKVEKLLSHCGNRFSTEESDVRPLPPQRRLDPPD